MTTKYQKDSDSKSVVYLIALALVIVWAVFYCTDKKDNTKLYGSYAATCRSQGGVPVIDPMGLFMCAAPLYTAPTGLHVVSR